MAIKHTKRKVAPKKDSAAASDIVVVGNYKTGQLDWVRKNGIYNWPVREEDDGHAGRVTLPADVNPAEHMDDAPGRGTRPACPLGQELANVKELWLYANAKSERHVFVAEFVGKMTNAEFLAAYPSYAKLGPSKQKAYYVFKTVPVDYPAELGNQIVLARTADFGKRCAKVKKAIEQFKQDGEFAPLAAYLPKELAKVPRPQLRVCEAAVQMEFPGLICWDFTGVSPRSEPHDSPLTKVHRCAMSLFSGAGGLDIGVLQAGFDVLSCVELDHNACDTLRRAVLSEHRKTKVYEGDIKSLSPDQIMSDLGKKSGEVDLLFGGPPCQAFSLIGKQKALEDERGMLLFQMVRYTRAIRPKVVLMEQVKGLLSAKDANGKKGGVFEMLLKDFEDLGYVVKYKVCLAADYGAAQLRERVILVATRDANGFQFPLPLFQNPKNQNLFTRLPAWRTVGDALSGLGKPHLKEKGVTVYSDEYRNHVDVTPARDRERIHYVPEGLYLASQSQLPPDILGNLQPRDTTKYLRLNRGKPSNTLRCGEIFFHPTEDRYLTPREYMRIHGYPDSYVLDGPIRSRTGAVKNLDQHRLVANSVPPPLARAIAAQIMSYLDSKS